MNYYYMSKGNFMIEMDRHHLWLSQSQKPKNKNFLLFLEIPLLVSHKPNTMVYANYS